jgi:hypothetical protein
MADRQEAYLERLRLQAASIEEGFFVGAGLEVPRYVGLIENLTSDILGRRVKETEVAREIAALDAQIVEAETHLSRLVEEQAQSPVRGVVWRRPASIGQYVHAGQELYVLADRDSICIEAYLHRRYLESVSIGDPAQIYLPARRKHVTGTVIARQGRPERGQRHLRRRPHHAGSEALRGPDRDRRGSPRCGADRRARPGLRRRPEEGGPGPAPHVALPLGGAPLTGVERPSRA